MNIDRIFQFFFCWMDNVELATQLCLSTQDMNWIIYVHTSERINVISIKYGLMEVPCFSVLVMFHRDELAETALMTIKLKDVFSTEMEYFGIVYAFQKNLFKMYSKLFRPCKLKVLMRNKMRSCSLLCKKYWTINTSIPMFHVIQITWKSEFAMENPNIIMHGKLNKFTEKRNFEIIIQHT